MSIAIFKWIFNFLMSIDMQMLYNVLRADFWNYLSTKGKDELCNGALKKE